jgi:hypothetical protein
MSLEELKRTEALEAELLEALQLARREWEEADPSARPQKKEAWLRALKAYSAFVLHGIRPTGREK